MYGNIYQMRRLRREEDECSYISRISEPTEESEFGCLCNIALAAVILVVVFLICGCSTCYVSILRSEYHEDGKALGIYNGYDEYPSLYPATKVTTTIEIPSWWWPSKMRIVRSYQIGLWPVGVVFSLVDLPVSIATDTFMFPYDLTNTIKNDEKKGQGKTMKEDDNYWAKISRNPKPSTKKFILDALCAETPSESIEGRPNTPTLPLVGSENVSISREEEKIIE